MYTREVTCGAADCENAAAYKVAAPWKTGTFSEFKSYGLACGEHIARAFSDAQQRAKAHPFSPEEWVGEIGIYAFERGKHDRELKRRKDLEGA